MLIVNFKTYQQGTGKNAVKLARQCQSVSKKIFIAVQPTDIYSVAKSVKNPILAQHCDGITYGAHTGAILPETIKEAGAAGSLINHSEKKLMLLDVIKAVKRLRELGMISVVCADSPQEAYKMYQAKPDYIAIEPPELIGTKISVSAAKPQSIIKTAKLGIPILCGAGIHSREDVRKAKQLGAKGILVASAVVLAENPKKILKEINV